MKKTKWAIVGTGYIANEFASGMAEVPDAELTAVVSRSEENGKKFAEKYGSQTVYTSIENLFQNETIDILYIAIPNDCHFSYIIKALNAGVSVLCEKPMVDNHKQLEQVKKLASEKQLFLMEGMWTRCFPAVVQAKKWLKNGEIGAPLTVHSGFDIKPDKTEWQVWKGGLEHSGSALRDVGIYALAMAYLAFEQNPLHTYSTMTFNGEVDDSFHMLADYGNGKAAFLSGSFNQIGNPKTEIIGESGKIIIGPEFWHPTTVELLRNDGTREVFEQSYPASGFQYEIQAVQECLRMKKLDNEYFPLAEAEMIADLIEQTRLGWGIRYKADEEEC